MKTIALTLITLLAMTAHAELKPAGTVQTLQCGYVNHGANQVGIESTANKVCLARITGDYGVYITVQPRLGATQVYQLIAQRASAFAPAGGKALDYDVKHVGIIGMGGLLQKQEVVGRVYRVAQLNYLPSNGLAAISMMDQSGAGIVAENFQVMFHTMSAASAQ